MSEYLLDQIAKRSKRLVKSGKTHEEALIIASYDSAMADKTESIKKRAPGKGRVRQSSDMPDAECLVQAGTRNCTPKRALPNAFIAHYFPDCGFCVLSPWIKSLDGRDYRLHCAEKLNSMEEAEHVAKQLRDAGTTPKIRLTK